MALPLGLVLAAGAGLLGAMLEFSPGRPVLGGAVLALAAAGPLTALAWVVLVDRSTLDDAAARPEESVEAVWYAEAAEGAFRDLLVFAGLSCVVLALAPVDVDGLSAMAAVIVVAFVSVGVRYTVRKRRGGQ